VWAGCSGVKADQTRITARTGGGFGGQIGVHKKGVYSQLIAPCEAASGRAESGTAECAASITL
jgi:hypothetical protein